MFEQSGMQDIFAGLQQNATKLQNDYLTHAKSVDNTLVKSSKNLSSEIKDFIKRLEKDGVKGGKTVSKNQADTQKHIELLSSHIGKGSGNVSKHTEDPFITHRGVLSRLDGQVQEENAHHSTLIALQNECAQFEAKIVRSIQDMIGQMSSQSSGQAQALQNSHQQLLNVTNSVSPSSEWNGFVARDKTLANPNAAPRTAKSVVFPGSEHESTKPVIEGDLLRKGTVIKKYSSAYYVLTPSGFLHEFKSKSFETDPDPAWSLDIKTCTIGGHSAPNTGKAKWTISGKTKGLMSSKHDFQFQATSYDDMLEWWTAIRKFATNSSIADEATADDSDSEPISPTVATSSPARAAGGHSTSPRIDERSAYASDAAVPASATGATPYGHTAGGSSYGNTTHDYTTPSTYGNESTYTNQGDHEYNSAAALPRGSVDNTRSSAYPSAAHGAA